ncbi:MAG: PAS domain S-box protein [Candidatus Omnitrophica bacterium]|nr:PAS domain S-box protein [Candidatus Omnitrophota bacterium]MCB9720346.1 PAS domain S-box protein [Candidatus Omnitrophota bacterium]
MLDPGIFRQVVEATAAGIIITDPKQQDNPIIYVNEGFIRMTGYAAEDAIGNNCRMMQRDDRQQPALARIRNAIKHGQHCHVTIRNYRKDGSMFWNELTVSPIRNPEGTITHFVGVQFNVTDSRMAEESLRKEQQILVYANKILLENQKTIQNLEREVNKWRKEAGESEIY